MLIDYCGDGFVATSAIMHTGRIDIGVCFMNSNIDLKSKRYKKARLGKQIGLTGFYILIALIILSSIFAIYCLFNKNYNLLAFITSPLILFFVIATWWKQDLSTLKPGKNGIIERLSYDALSNLPDTKLDNKIVFDAFSKNWQSYFVLNHLMLNAEMVRDEILNDDNSLEDALKIASQIADEKQSATIEVGFIVAAQLMQSNSIKEILIKSGNKDSDIKAVVDWLCDLIVKTEKHKKYYGGIGRDWSHGWTPLLNSFGLNISVAIMKYGANYGWLTASEGVKNIEAAFDNNSKAVVLIGADGIGKSSTVYALAQKLIEGQSTTKLSYKQIIGINAMDIASNAKEPGDLEELISAIFNEAQRAKHVILFVDDAQTFFSDQPGTFDASQILANLIQSSGAPIILAMTEDDFQRLRTKNQSLANLITSVTLQERSESDVMHVLEDIALGLENTNKLLIPYGSLRTAYQLSGRFNQDLAYPGKAIKLLQESVPNAIDTILTKESIEKTIEQTSGVKITQAAPQESQELLNMESAIHQRMINQTHAVKVVSNALRRARAGVANPKRPIGSFLFLGPTGVGKTELAKSIAAVFFGDENSMIRIDMSEYQQPDDVQRLLATGEDEQSSLLMSIRKTPYTVVLLDEIEKAHPNILNLLLQLLDEGQLTDASGKVASFKESVVIATSNAGAQSIRQHIEKGENLEDFSEQFTNNLIDEGSFKPELLNRFDEIVLFRPLNNKELGQVVEFDGARC
jgi:ATP-dependent Clp protease ATP-binding subunit ClpC